MQTLQSFKIINTSPLFTDADPIPEFFVTNLVSDDRKIKVFPNLPDSYLKIFYFQFLKLCFETEDTNYNTYLQKVERIINDPKFSFIFVKQEDPTIFNDGQFKNLLNEFFHYLGNSKVTVEEALNLFKIMDLVLIYFLKAVLQYAGKTIDQNDIENNHEVLGMLSQIFAVKLIFCDQCLRFEDTDIFVYQENYQNIYMVYIQTVFDSTDGSLSKLRQIQQSKIGKLCERIDSYTLDERCTNTGKTTREGSYNEQKKFPSKSIIQPTPQMEMKALLNQTIVSNEQDVTLNPVKQPAKIVNILRTPNSTMQNKINTSQIYNNDSYTPVDDLLRQYKKLGANDTYSKSPPVPVPISYENPQFQANMYKPKFPAVKEYEPAMSSKITTKNYQSDFYTKNYRPSFIPQSKSQYQAKAYTNPTNPPRFNITRQFTNSIVMKSMKEPYKSNVCEIRERARRQRASINNIFK